MFEVEFTEQFEAWWDGLSIDQQVAISARIDVLAQRGPALLRPLVGAIKGSAFDPQMKELRVDEHGSLRILFMFDPRRVAILLIGGDKSGRWQDFYNRMIPVADRLYREHLREIESEDTG